MKNFAGLRLVPCLLIPCLLMGGRAAVAQDASGAIMPPPKVLVIEREWVKPGKSGAIHEKSESAFVNAAKAAKWQTHYVAATSMSGRPRALFLFAYPSFAAWEKDNHALQKNTALAAAIDRAALADGDLLNEFNQSVFTLDEENSLRSGDAVHARYFEFTQFKVKPGHRKDWMDLVKIYRNAFEKVVPNAHWALYESYYGENNGGYYIVISTMKSLSEDDESMGDGKKIQEALGAEGMKHVAELTAACVDEQQTNLFEINPKMSYPADEWIKADDFWKPKMTSATPRKAAPENP